jgi:nitrate reductase NapD
MKALGHMAAAAGAAAEREIHIAGALIHSRPLNLLQVVRAIDILDGAEVYQSSAEGKIVVVIEAPTGKQVLDVLDAIRALPGVLNVSLVYQHAEPAQSMQQELKAWA